MKTQTVVFESGRKTKTEVPKLRLGNDELNYTDSLQYLGIILQKRLTWTTHIKNQLKKTNQLVGMARRTIGKEWRLTPDKMMWVHKTIARH